MRAWQSILDDLRNARPGWVCGGYFYATYRPTFAQRISLDLKPRGYVVESRVCQQHLHTSTIHEYKLVAEPVPKQMALNTSPS